MEYLKPYCFDQIIIFESSRGFLCQKLKEEILMLVKNILNVIEKSYSVLSDQGEWVCTNCKED